MQKEIENELSIFMKQYEDATNSHDFENVRPLLSRDAIYFFSDRNLYGIEEIANAFKENFTVITDETYSIKNVSWVGVSDTVGVCIYDFHWVGMMDGKKKEGNGRGTNVVVKKDGNWLLMHEHLSTPKHSV